MKGLMERALFGSSRRDILRITGQSSISELTTRNEMRLPLEIVEHTSYLVESTREDLLERWAIFGVEGRRVIIQKEGVGEGVPKVNDGKLTFSSEASLRAFVPYVRYFARPLLVHFHTHPYYTKEYLNKLMENQTLKIGQYENVNLDQFWARANYDSDTFSEADLKTMETHSRYFRSMLLGSARGYRWIIKPNFKIPLTDLERHSQVYAEGLQRLGDKVLSLAGERELRKTDINQFSDRGKELLKQFCERKGYVVFGNRDYKSPILKKF